VDVVLVGDEHEVVVDFIDDELEVLLAVVCVVEDLLVAVATELVVVLTGGVGLLGIAMVMVTPHVSMYVMVWHLWHSPGG
jgi:hypothetical protein